MSLLPFSEFKGLIKRELRAIVTIVGKVIKLRSMRETDNSYRETDAFEQPKDKEALS